MNLIKLIQTTLNPAGYHGTVKKPPFFEGWYFKLVSASGADRYAIIPGIFLDKNPEESHAFLQVLDGSAGTVVYRSYPASEFHGSQSGFDIRVGPSRFTSTRISLDVDDPALRMRGELAFDPLIPWPVSLTSPGIMGWYAWVPRMECYHGVLGFDHGISGSLEINGCTVDFNGGRGYIEKDWGMSFPSAWVWFQSNHFEKPGTCITASVAVIPWGGSSFPGFIVGLFHAGRLYPFATYNGARSEKLKINDERVHWVLRRGRYRLEMNASRAGGGLLHAPTPTGMGRCIAETLNAVIDLRLTEIQPHGSRLVFAGSGRNAGLEAVGDLASLVP